MKGSLMLYGVGRNRDAVCIAVYYVISDTGTDDMFPQKKSLTHYPSTVHIVALLE
jgi:hypothetical protein